MSETLQNARIEQLPGNTLLHSEVHTAVMDIARANSTEPQTITFFKRGKQTCLYHSVVNTVADVGVHEELSHEHESVVGAYKIFPYDEFYVSFTNGETIKFMTPGLIKESRRRRT